MSGRGRAGGEVNLVGAGFALTALSYGLARFAYGLLLPAIRHDIPLDAATAGAIGGSAFGAYCIGIVFALVASGPVGERPLAVMAGSVATLGLALVAVASSGGSLGLAIALGGLSTGLTSPPLAAAVARSLDAGIRPRANGIINTGTAAGIILSGVAAMAAGATWRELYGLFAAAGVATTAWLWVAVPTGRTTQASGALILAELGRAGVAALCGSAFLTGAASTAIWTFGASIIRDDFGMGDGGVAIAWIVLGAAGLGGAATGSLIGRLGIGRVHRLSLLAMVVALLGFAAASRTPLTAFAVMAVFGVAYMVCTGAFLVWGIALFPMRPAFGLGLPFLVFALGQTAGAPLFGLVLDAAGGAAALFLFAAMMGCAAIPTETGATAWVRSATP